MEFFLFFFLRDVSLVHRCCANLALYLCINTPSILKNRFSLNFHSSELKTFEMVHDNALGIIIREIHNSK